MSDRLSEERTREEKGDGVAPRLFVIPLTIQAPRLSPSMTGASSASPSSPHSSQQAPSVSSHTELCGTHTLLIQSRSVSD